jgi:L-asparaginase
MSKKTNILLIYTGGTIGMVKDYKTNVLHAFDFNNIRQRIPELNHLDCNINTISFEHPIDSSNMNKKYWIKITQIIKDNYNNVDGFVVLTGSDTMSYTSSAISFMLDNLSKPVIFTGSQLPIGDLRTDAKENLITAIQIASATKNGKSIINEVCLYFEYKLYRANRTTKINAEHFEAFSSPNFPHIAESGVHLKFENHLLAKPQKSKKLIVRENLDENIVILKLFPGISLTAIKNILSIKNLKGVILETYGSGNASTEKGFINLLKDAIKKGIKIIDVTQCNSGRVILGQYETSTKLKEIGVINGKDITTEAAVAKLMYLLGEINVEKDFKINFEKSLRGEMTD